MKFTKDELLRIYVALSNAIDLEHSLGGEVTDKFKKLMGKIHIELTQEKDNFNNGSYPYDEDPNGL